MCATYNRVATIQRAIDSVLAQKYFNWELLIIDDGSEDNTHEIVQMNLSDPRLTYHRLNQNCGVGFARNYGISQAKYDWIVLIDSDNHLSADALHAMSIAHKKNPSIEMHKFCVENFYGQLVCDRPSATTFLNAKQFLQNQHKGEFHTLVRKKYLEKYRFIENVNGGEGIIWSRIAIDCKRIAYHPEVTQYYDTEGLDRLSIKRKNHSRLCRIFALDILYLWSNYIRLAPSRLLINIGKMAYYFGAMCIDWLTDVGRKI